MVVMVMDALAMEGVGACFVVYSLYFVVVTCLFWIAYCFLAGSWLVAAYEIGFLVRFV
jgi:hypothetical protein